MAIIRTFRELELDIPEVLASSRASDEGPILADTAFDEFLQRQPPSYVDGILGPERAALWRDGAVACRDFVDDRGQLIPIERLIAQYERPVE